jgi:hypothetical protein
MSVSDQKKGTLLVLYGLPAVGKLTIAKELQQLLAGKMQLFHNHLVVDTLLSLFEFGSENFVKHRENMWISMMEDAIAEGKSVIFTFNPENTVNNHFPATLQEAIVNRGGRCLFVELVCSDNILETRIESHDRKTFKKLSSLDFYRHLKDEGAFDFPSSLPVDLRIDTSANSPAVSAGLIIEALKL